MRMVQCYPWRSWLPYAVMCMGMGLWALPTPYTEKQLHDNGLSFLDSFVEGEIRASSVLQGNKKTRISRRSSGTVPVPKYMLDLYEILLNRTFHVKFDTARSYQSSDLTEVKMSSRDTRYENLSSLTVLFDISNFPNTEIALFAQLRIQTTSMDMDGAPVVDVYSVLSGPPVFLTTQRIYKAKPLVTLNVTSFFLNNLRIGKREMHFQLRFPNSVEMSSAQFLVLSRNQYPDAEDRVFDRMKRSLDSSRNSILRSTKQHTSVSERHRRSEDDDEETEEQSNYIVEELGRIRKGKLKKKKNPCRRKPLHVNFATIHYDQWIIAPPSYEAFECTGRCSFPMSAHLAPTKHAIIQTLMHSLEPKQVSRACCVPIKLAPISILYVEDDGTVTYKYDYEDMVVAECGCR